MELAALEPATSWVQFRICSVTRLLEMRVRVRTVFARMTAALALPRRKPCKSRADAQTRTGDPFTTS